MHKILAILFSLSLAFLLVASVSAQSNPVLSNDSNIPERNGDYPDPLHPGVRVRVFVHEPRQQLTTLFSLACNDDASSSAVVRAAGWELSGTVNYKVNASSAPASVGGTNFVTFAQTGFGTWTGSIISNKPTLNYSGNTSKTRSSYDGQNIIAWGRTQGTALGVTYIRYYTSTGQVVDVDTIMNKKFPWSYGVCDSNSYDVQNILTHEQGHWFGLDDEYDSNFINNTMYGYGAKAETKKITPTQGDIDGINFIYR